VYRHSQPDSEAHFKGINSRNSRPDRYEPRRPARREFGQRMKSNFAKHPETRRRFSPLPLRSLVCLISSTISPGRRINAKLVYLLRLLSRWGLRAEGTKVLGISRESGRTAGELTQRTLQELAGPGLKGTKFSCVRFIPTPAVSTKSGNGSKRFHEIARRCSAGLTTTNP